MFYNAVRYRRFISFYLSNCTNIPPMFAKQSCCHFDLARFTTNCFLANEYQSLTGSSFLKKCKQNSEHLFIRISYQLEMFLFKGVPSWEQNKIQKQMEKYEKIRVVGRGAYG